MNRFGMQRKVVFLLLGLVCTLQAQAGRPLTVDDANVNDAGEGHVEGWWTRAPNGLRTNILPKLQLDASVGRQAGQNLVTLGTKWMF